MTVKKLLKKDLKVEVTEEQSKELQPLLFKHGYRWAGDLIGSRTVKNTKAEYLFLYQSKNIRYDDNKRYFKQRSNKEVTAPYLIYVLKGENFTKRSIKKHCIRHYNRMIEYARLQNPEETPSTIAMLRQIGENYSAVYCAMCGEYRVQARCGACPLKAIGEDCTTCTSTYNKMSYAPTWKTWLERAKKLRKILKSLPVADQQKEKSAQDGPVEHRYNFGAEGEDCGVTLVLERFQFGNGLTLRMKGNDSGHILGLNEDGTMRLERGIKGVPGLQTDDHDRVVLVE